MKNNSKLDKEEIEQSIQQFTNLSGWLAPSHDPELDYFADAVRRIRSIRKFVTRLPILRFFRKEKPKTPDPNQLLDKELSNA